LKFLTDESLAAGFAEVEQVPHGFFDGDCSGAMVRGRLLSLNVKIRKVKHATDSDSIHDP
jgi:hypothetical protein